MKAGFGFVAGAVVAAGVTGGAAVAQDMGKFGIEAGVSTLGAFVAPTYDVNDRLSLRLPVYLGSTSGDFEVEDNTVDGKFAVNSVALMADFSPWSNAWRVSGGLGIGGYDLSGTTNNLTLDGNTYAGVSTVKVTQNEDLAPILSIGYHKEFASGLTIFGDVGGRIATYQMSVSTEAVLSPADQADLDASLADVNSDLADVGVTPFISFGLGFKF